jgi:acyl dehydratase
VTITLSGTAELLSSAGTRIGPSRWMRITQSEVDAFGSLTGDRNWLHVDPVAASRGPFGRTIVHGYFTLCVIPVLLIDVLAVSGCGIPVNYGCNRVRFPRPLGVDEEFRLSGEISTVGSVRGGLELVIAAAIECEQGGKPACVADVVIRYLATEPEARRQP